MLDFRFNPAPKAAAPAAGAPADNRNFLQKGFDSVANFHKQNTERFNAKQAADAAAGMANQSPNDAQNDDKKGSSDDVQDVDFEEVK